MSSRWDFEILPQERLWSLRLSELWRYRDLIWLFVRRDFVSYYKQTILGPLWYLVQPLLTTVVFTLIFGRVAGLSTDGQPQFLFYMAGVTVWGYFSDCLTGTADTFIKNANVFGKVYFPRLCVPVSIVLSNLIKLVTQLLFFVGFLLYSMYRGEVAGPSWSIALLPVLVGIMAGLGLGFGVFVSALTTKYRDLRFLITFGVQLLMYATPVVYPRSAVPAQYLWLLDANPLTAVVETFRTVWLGAGEISLIRLAYSASVMVVIVVLGTVLFHRVERTFMDTV